LLILSDLLCCRELAVTDYSGAPCALQLRQTQQSLNLGITRTKINYFADPSDICHAYSETFEKCSILFETKAGENFNHRHTLSISRIKI